jgi:hypothetical protein
MTQWPMGPYATVAVKVVEQIRRERYDPLMASWVRMSVFSSGQRSLIRSLDKLVAH